PCPPASFFVVTRISTCFTSILTLHDALPIYVSDIHINPIAWNVIRSLKDQFAVDLIIDTGDISDHGTKAENKFVEEIGTLGVPRSEEHTSELQSREKLVCRLLLEKK